jgi:hypothetical protein
MRIASSPTLRIAAGLLLAVPLSVVGYQVVRRLNSHGPVAQLERAAGSSCLHHHLRTAALDIERAKTSPALSGRQDDAASGPIYAASNSSISIASRDRIIDLPIAPDFAWCKPTLGWRPVDSLKPKRSGRLRKPKLIKS